MARLTKTLDANRSTIAAVLAVLLFADTVLVARAVLRPDDPTPAARSLASARPGDAAPRPPRAQPLEARTTPAAARAAELVREARAGTFLPGYGTVPHGIRGNEITVVYYWSDRTQSSQFLTDERARQRLDEGDAFRHLIAWINAHADGGELMGFPFDLQGWRLKPHVVEVGKGDKVVSKAEEIATTIRPLAALSSHGSISSTVCLRLARAGIFNLSTYDLNWDLLGRTNGFCRPQGLSWGSQVELTKAYLADQVQTSPYAGTKPEKRVYGLLYAEYEADLVHSIGRLERELRAAGIPIAAVAPVDPDPTAAQRQQPLVVSKFREAGVNTIIAPEAGSLITFTQAAQASGYTPDYYVWPCSGQDSLGMVRIYNSAQWTRASGLTCYDPQLNADLTNDEDARRSEWYRAYQEAAGPDAEPPAPTSLVYQSLLPLLAGITHAGKILTVERFRDGLARAMPYRYDAVDGRTADPTNLLITLDAGDGSLIGDAAKVRWDPASDAGSVGAPPGDYVFLETRRYRPGERF